MRYLKLVYCPQKLSSSGIPVGVKVSSNDKKVWFQTMLVIKHHHMINVPQGSCAGFLRTSGTLYCTITLCAVPKIIISSPNCLSKTYLNLQVKPLLLKYKAKLVKCKKVKTVHIPVSFFLKQMILIHLCVLQPFLKRQR